MYQYLTTIAALVAAATAHCTLDQLNTGVEAYLKAQRTGETTGFTSIFDNYTWLGYFENSKKLTIHNNTLSKPLPISHTRTIRDLSLCSTYTEVVVDDAKDPYVIGTQLRFGNHKVNKVDSIVTKPGDWLFNITGFAYWTARENWDAIAVEKRDSRKAIRSAADAYLDLFSNPNTTVPWGTPCVRLEGGLYGDPGPNGTCNVGVPQGVPLTNRRYVVDETVGSVQVLLDFGKSKWPDSHQFRVEEGKIRYVHTLTHCGVPNCGLS